MSQENKDRNTKTWLITGSGLGYALAKYVLEKVNNAGIDFLGAIKEQDERDYRAQFEVNFFGAVALSASPCRACGDASGERLSPRFELRLGNLKNELSPAEDVIVILGQS